MQARALSGIQSECRQPSPDHSCGSAHFPGNMPKTAAKKNWNEEADAILNRLFESGKIAFDLEKKFGTDLKGKNEYLFNKSVEHLEDYVGSRGNVIRRLEKKARAYLAEQTARGARKERAERKGTISINAHYFYVP